MSIKKVILALFLLLPLPCFANVTAQYDVRTTGSNTNGGCFDPTVTSPGTDYSQQNTAQVTYTDLVIGTTNTQLTSVLNPFGSTLVGNCIFINTGVSGFTSGWYEINSVSGITATMDRAVGTASATGGTGQLGGALATFYPPFASSSLESSTFWIKSGTYTVTATNNLAPATSNNFFFYGYNSTHGDGGTAPLITTATNSVTLFNSTAVSVVYTLTNINFSNTASTRGTAFAGSSDFITCVSCTMTGFLHVWAGASPLQLINSFVTSSTGIAFANNSQGLYLYNTVVQNGSLTAYQGTNTGDSLTAIDCIFYNNAGYAIQASTTSSWRGNLFLVGNSIVDNSSGGIYVQYLGAQNGSSVGQITQFENNILYGNGSYGISVPAGLSKLIFTNQYNAYGANSTGARQNLAAGNGDVTLTADPFTNESGGNFSLNATTGGGAALRGAGYPGTLLGVSTTGYRDIGAVQHQDTGTSTPSNYGSSY